jgi:Zn-dependent metalloprotease
VRAAAEHAVDMARRTYARVDPDGDDGLGKVRMGLTGGSHSSYNRITGRLSVGTAGVHDEQSRLELLESTAHETSHRWFDKRAGWGGLVYAGPSGRLSEGLAQVMAGASLALEGATPAEQAWGWRLLDPRGRTTPEGEFRRHEVPLSVTMDDVRRSGFTLSDQGYVHVHSGVIQAAHLEMAKALGMEQMARITTDAARHDLTPVTGFKAWADATIRSAGRLYGDDSAAQDSVRAAWDLVKVEHHA